MWIIAVPEREEEEQEIENLLEKIMKENFPNLVKGSRHANPGSTVSPKQVMMCLATPRHIIIKMPKVKDKERILETSREKQRLTYKGVS